MANKDILRYSQSNPIFNKIMGSVKEKHFTPDNDPDPSPSEWHRHYYYCDNCGSFDLVITITPRNHKDLKSRVKVYRNISKIGVFVIVAGVFLIFLSFIFIWFIILGVMCFIISNFYARQFESRIKVTGVRCKHCKTKYNNESAFMIDTESNPRNFTMKNVPKPLYDNYTRDVW